MSPPSPPSSDSTSTLRRRNGLERRSWPSKRPFSDMGRTLSRLLKKFRASGVRTASFFISSGRRSVRWSMRRFGTSGRSGTELSRWTCWKTSRPPPPASTQDSINSPSLRRVEYEWVGQTPFPLFLDVVCLYKLTRSFSTHHRYLWWKVWTWRAVAHWQTLSMVSFFRATRSSPVKYVASKSSRLHLEFLSSFTNSILTINQADNKHILIPFICLLCISNDMPDFWFAHS